MKSTGKYKVILIEEGLGNLKTLFFYTREAIQYAVDNKIFDGKKAYADHPSKFEEATRPERSVKDIIGHYEDCEVVDGDDGQAQLQATLVTIEGENYDWARSMIEAALAYSGKFDTQLIGLSINASGNSQKKDIDNIIADETLPVSVKPKLLKAKGEGATEVEYCTELQEAVSVDLVTEAGARGRIVKMIESERARMATKTAKENEMEKKQAEEAKKQAEKKAAEKKQAGSDAGGDHDDEEQDKELIKSMLKKYVGGDDHSEEEMEAMHQAYQNAKEMGLKGEEAEDMAGHSMKMAHHVAQKQKKQAEENADPGASDPDKKAESEKKEAEVVALNGRVAMLEAQLQAEKVEKTITKTIRESGFEGPIEKAYLKAIGTPKTEKEVVEKTKIFKEALGAASNSTGGFYNPEKAAGGGDQGFSLAGCVKAGE